MGKPMSDNPKRKILQVPLTQAQYDEIKAEAIRRDVTMAKVVRPMITTNFEKVMQPAE